MSNVLLDELIPDDLIIHLLNITAETFAEHLIPLSFAEALRLVYLEHLFHAVQL